MATVLQFTTEEQRYFLWAKGLGAKIFKKKCSLLTMGNVVA
jgi:hypothetical protein